jgi:hypothetical protein
VLPWEKNSSYWIFSPCLYPEYLPVEGIEKCFTDIKFRKKAYTGHFNLYQESVKLLKRALFISMVLLLLFGIEIADG